MSPPKIIGLCGYGGSGKDTVADFLSTTHVKVAFADKPRELLHHLNPFLPTVGEFYNDLVTRVGYEHAKRTYPEVRQWLIKLAHGTRAIIGEDVWIDACRLHNFVSTNSLRVVVSDVRYANEAAKIHSLGGEIWYIFRPGVDAASPEEKESIRSVKIDTVVTNSGSLADLRETVAALIR